MKNIILLRFHKDVVIVQNRIDILRKFNPNILIYGLFGGDKSQFEFFKQKLTGIENIQLLGIAERKFKWRFSDLCILKWYEQYGQTLDFDRIYTIEYDLLILQNLEDAISMNEGQIALTGLIDLDLVKENWYWFYHEPYKSESGAFLRYITNEYGITEFSACLGPGTVLTRDFLEKYLHLQPPLPTIAHDELRLPQLAKVFGIQAVDNGFYSGWRKSDVESEKYFNCEQKEVSSKKIKFALENTKRKVFHPVYKAIPLEDL